MEEKKFEFSPVKIVTYLSYRKEARGSSMNPYQFLSATSDAEPGQPIQEQARKAFAHYMNAGEKLDHKVIRWQMYQDRMPDRILKCMHSDVATYVAWLADFRLAVFNEPLLEKEEKKKRLQNMTTEDWLSKNTAVSMILYFETKDSLDARNRMIDHLTTCNFVCLDAVDGRASFRGGRSDDQDHELQLFSDEIRSFGASNDVSIYAIYRIPDPGMALFFSEDFVQKQKTKSLFFLPQGGTYVPYKGPPLPSRVTGTHIPPGKVEFALQCFRKKQKFRKKN